MFSWYQPVSISIKCIDTKNLVVNANTWIQLVGESGWLIEPMLAGGWVLMVGSPTNLSLGYRMCRPLKLEPYVCPYRI